MAQAIESIIVAGSGRSGTTWLCNMLAAQPTTRVVFEPLDSRRVAEAAVFPSRPYARPNGDYPQWREAFERILSGKVRNDWVERERRKWWPEYLTRRRVVKEIRANLLLGWASREFRCPIAFVTRHPCAVVHSRMRLGWQTHLDSFTSQTELVLDHLGPHMDVIAGAETAAERHAVMWCVENVVPLRQVQQFNWSFCTYEALCLQPDVEVRRLAEELRLPYNWMTRRAVGRVSSVARGDSAVVTQADPVRQWRNEMARADIDAVLRVVDAFGICLYSADPLPRQARMPK